MIFFFLKKRRVAGVAAYSPHTGGSCSAPVFVIYVKRVGAGILGQNFGPKFLAGIFGQIFWPEFWPGRGQ